MEIKSINAQINSALSKIQGFKNSWTVPVEEYNAARSELCEAGNELEPLGASFVGVVGEEAEIVGLGNGFEAPMFGAKLQAIGYNFSLWKVLDKIERQVSWLAIATNENGLSLEAPSQDDESDFFGMMDLKVMPEANPLRSTYDKLQQQREQIRSLMGALCVDPEALFAAAREIERRGSRDETENEWNDDQNFAFPKSEHGPELLDESELASN